MLAKMDAGRRDPELRRFATDPIDVVLADRGRCIADILIIARAYLVAGEPIDVAPYGSYPGWDRFVRRPLLWLDEPDPLLCQKSMTSDDPVRLRRSAIIDAWFGAFGMEPKTLAEAVVYATTVPVFHAAHGDEDQNEINRLAYLAHKEHQEELLGVLREAFPAGRDGIDTVKWAWWMRRFEGRQTGVFRFVRGEISHKVARWKLVKIVSARP